LIYKTCLNDSFTNFQNLLTQSGHSGLKLDEGNIITEYELNTLVFGTEIVLISMTFPGFL